MTNNTFPSEVFAGLDYDNAKLIADRSIEVWEVVARALVPLIGDKGFVILFVRCVHITRTAYPWLALGRIEPGPDRFDGLGKILEGRSGADALAASRALLAAFHDALAVLIGAPLTNAMLHAIWDRGDRGALPSEVISS
jgi:hypothetical protein